MNASPELARRAAAEGLAASALVSGELGSIWIYVVGPVLGAVAGALAYQLVRGGSEG